MIKVKERTQAAITQPEVIKDFLCPLDSQLKELIRHTRAVVTALVHSEKQDDQLLIVTGPVAITDSQETKACAEWIKSKNSPYSGDPYTIEKVKLGLFQPTRHLKVLMNANVTHLKPHVQSRSASCALSSGSNHTSYSSTGALSSEPYFLSKGLVNARQQLVQICNSGVALAGSMDDPIAQVYFNDLFSVGIAPRLCGRFLVDVASEGTHAVGFHSRADELGFVQRDCVSSCKSPRSYLTVMNLGQVGVVTTVGNSDTFIAVNLKEVVVAIEDFEQRLVRDLDQDVKLLFEVGRVTSVNFKSRLEMIKLVFRSQWLKKRLLGFMIDSGEHYIHKERSSAPGASNNGGDENEGQVEYSPISEELSQSPKKTSVGNFMLKSLVASYNKLSLSLKPRHSSAQLEPLYYADKLISEIGRMVEQARA
ncbi:Phospho-2-dehydro-3-deoxyheptonate aldolase, tyrosine-inhibited [Cyberlindnera fabianii]|uniref:3-deoxy-D-arabino-heptulosonate 7-phosphate synthase n=1 Tax=Cyberlindnera fabianii TaxID=36022 RepID=A0A1V2L9K1_CYBFA|nr:Phospho-2-dehydro-3-deoxyheptonate aldolase, tyrosine-inhibited [Cyberlindnera fabianii]